MYEDLDNEIICQNFFSEMGERMTCLYWHTALPNNGAITRLYHKQ